MKLKSNKWVVSIAAAAMLLATATAAFADAPKYMFFFLGDGMASAQIQSTEAYLATKYAVDNGWMDVSTYPDNPAKPDAPRGDLNAEYLLDPENRLNMTQMPVAGMQTTYDAFALQTDSASSATAFACGLKTRSGVIGMDDEKKKSYKSIAQLAHEQGKRVGILSSVSLDHATPAAYYASVASRDYMNNIASQMAATGYAFFGGGGLAKPTSAKTDGDTSNDVWQLLSDNGYTVLNDKADILALKDSPINKVVCINPELPGSAAMPYAIDKPEENLSLAEMTEVAIETLYDLQEQGGNGNARSRGRGKGLSNGGNGFFIMVEGGKIDWACHANDAMATIGDMIDFDDAVGKALAFYEEHPNETLIVVTGDHETGGMTIGHATTAYKAYYDQLFGQVKSYENFQVNEWAAHKAAYKTEYDYTSDTNLVDNDGNILGLLETCFGLSYETLNDYQKEKLEDAYDKAMTDDEDRTTPFNGDNYNSDAENNLLYGSYNPFIVTITHILNERASIGWTSYSHTGVPVPIFAQGAGAEAFAGFYDNTDIAKKLAEVMDVHNMPVQK